MAMPGSTRSNYDAARFDIFQAHGEWYDSLFSTLDFFDNRPASAFGAPAMESIPLVSHLFKRTLPKNLDDPFLDLLKYFSNVVDLNGESCTHELYMNLIRCIFAENPKEATTQVLRTYNNNPEARIRFQYPGKKRVGPAELTIKLLRPNTLREDDKKARAQAFYKLLCQQFRAFNDPTLITTQGDKKATARHKEGHKTFLKPFKKALSAMARERSTLGLKNPFISTSELVMEKKVELAAHPELLPTDDRQGLQPEIDTLIRNAWNEAGPEVTLHTKQLVNQQNIIKTNDVTGERTDHVNNQVATLKKRIEDLKGRVKNGDPTKKPELEALQRAKENLITALELRVEFIKCLKLPNGSKRVRKLTQDLRLINEKYKLERLATAPVLYHDQFKHGDQLKLEDGTTASLKSTYLERFKQYSIVTDIDEYRRRKKRAGSGRLTKPFIYISPQDVSNPYTLWDFEIYRPPKWWQRNFSPEKGTLTFDQIPGYDPDYYPERGEDPLPDPFMNYAPNKDNNKALRHNIALTLEKNSARGIKQSLRKWLFRSAIGVGIGEGFVAGVLSEAPIPLMVIVIITGFLTNIFLSYFYTNAVLKRMLAHSNRVTRFLLNKHGNKIAWYRKLTLGSGFFGTLGTAICYGMLSFNSFIATADPNSTISVKIAYLLLAPLAKVLTKLFHLTLEAAMTTGTIALGTLYGVAVAIPTVFCMFSLLFNDWAKLCRDVGWEDATEFSKQYLTFNTKFSFQGAWDNIKAIFNLATIVATFVGAVVLATATLGLFGSSVREVLKKLLKPAAAQTSGFVLAVIAQTVAGPLALKSLESIRSAAVNSIGAPFHFIQKFFILSNNYPDCFMRLLHKKPPLDQREKAIALKRRKAYRAKIARRLSPTHTARQIRRNTYRALSYYTKKVTWLAFIASLGPNAYGQAVGLSSDKHGANDYLPNLVSPFTSANHLTLTHNVIDPIAQCVEVIFSAKPNYDAGKDCLASPPVNQTRRTLHTDVASEDSKRRSKRSSIDKMQTKRKSSDHIPATMEADLVEDNKLQKGLFTKESMQYFSRAAPMKSYKHGFFDENQRHNTCKASRALSSRTSKASTPTAA
jgi:hypothetical protein